MHESSRETPTPAHTLEKLASALAGDDSRSVWAGVDMDFLRPHFGRVAREVLTERQWEILSLFIAGDLETEIAARLQISQPTVHKAIFGDGDRGGAMKKLKARLENDETFLSALAASREGTQVDDDTAIIVRNWFQHIGPSHYQAFVPMAALLVMFFLRDKKAQISYATLRQHLPSPVVTAAMRMLVPLGYVHTDGITITVKKTPLGEVKR
jgi:hypothetical protein